MNAAKTQVARYKTTTRQTFNYRAVLAVGANPCFYDGVEPRRPNTVSRAWPITSLRSAGRACFQLRQLRLVRSSLTSQPAKTLVHAFVSSRLDYCNCLLYGVRDIC